ncbi:MAG: heme ABC exporter ATP-binding protein CcmA [Roseovarius sp.]
MITLSDLCVARGGVAVLQDVSLTLSAGQALVLRGPNGIGKTTLLRTIAGLQPALSGKVSVDPDLLAYIGHADGIKSTLSVTENLTFWARVFGQSDITQALSAYQLALLADRPAGMLSAGQKRRLGLARLLVTGRKLWILDEPTVSLDADAVAMFAETIHAHLAAGGAAIFATHIDLGLHRAEVLDLTPFKATARAADAFDEAFL